MRDSEFKAKISLLKDIKPRKDWVILTKQKIMKESPVFKPESRPFTAPVSDIVSVFKFMRARPAYVMSALVVLIIFGGLMLQITLNSLPGDNLYPVKTALWQVKVRVLALNEIEAMTQLGLAQRSLDDLKRAAEENRVKNLSFAIQEFEARIAEASKEIKTLVENQPSEALQATMGIVQLQRDKVVVEQILGTVIGEESGELESAIKLLVESELSDLQERSLTDTQQSLAAEAQSAYDIGEYETALEKLWMVSNH